MWLRLRVLVVEEEESGRFGLVGSLHLHLLDEVGIFLEDDVEVSVDGVYDAEPRLGRVASEASDDDVGHTMIAEICDKLVGIGGGDGVDAVELAPAGIYARHIWLTASYVGVGGKAGRGAAEGEIVVPIGGVAGELVGQEVATESEDIGLRSGASEEDCGKEEDERPHDLHAMTTRESSDDVGYGVEDDDVHERDVGEDEAILIPKHLEGEEGEGEHGGGRHGDEEDGAVALVGDGGTPKEEGVEQDCRRRGLAAAVDIAETEHFEVMLGEVKVGVADEAFDKALGGLEPAGRVIGVDLEERVELLVIIFHLAPRGSADAEPQTEDDSYGGDNGSGIDPLATDEQIGHGSHAKAEASGTDERRENHCRTDEKTPKGDLLPLPTSGGIKTEEAPNEEPLEDDEERLAIREAAELDEPKVDSHEKHDREEETARDGAAEGKIHAELPEDDKHIGCELETYDADATVERDERRKEEWV